ncbi:MAG: ParB N-terminal domain-containing protein, partial [Acholeplasmataceae bacterium]
MTWESRIIGHGEMDPHELIPNPKNWRTHPKLQEKALEGALEDIGWIQDVIVNERTGKLLDGHLRVELAKKRGEHKIPVVMVDLSEEEEELALITLD